jgi:hypothetical protein
MLLKSDPKLRIFSNHSSCAVDEKNYLNTDSNERLRNRMKIAELSDKFLFGLKHEVILNEIIAREGYFYEKGFRFETESFIFILLCS